MQRMVCNTQDLIDEKKLQYKVYNEGVAQIINVKLMSDMPYHSNTIND
jgi:hypothetical protein